MNKNIITITYFINELDTIGLATFENLPAELVREITKKINKYRTK